MVQVALRHIVQCVVITATLSGCALPGNANKCGRIPNAIPVVETGGPFAVSRIIEIPANGLTLSDAVESSLRPGIATQAAAISGAGVNSSALPVGSTVAIEDRLISALSFTIRPSENAEEKLRQKADGIVSDLYSNDENADDKDAFRSKLVALMTAAASDGLFKPFAASDVSRAAINQQIRQQLFRTIIVTYVFSDFAEAGSPSDLQLQRMQRRISQIASIAPGDSRSDLIFSNLITSRDRGGVFKLAVEPRQDALDRLLVPPVVEPSAAAPSSMIVPTASRSLADELAVVLSRQSGRRLIFPLQLVRTYLPGDIRLADGDQIQIVPFPKSVSSEMPANVEGAIGVTGWFSADALAVPIPGGSSTSVWDVLNQLEDRPTDVVVLRRASETGGIDEYFLPADDVSRLSSFGLQDLDLVHLDNFGVNPLIRQSTTRPRSSRCGVCDRSNGAASKAR